MSDGDQKIARRIEELIKDRVTDRNGSPAAGLAAKNTPIRGEDEQDAHLLDRGRCAKPYLRRWHGIRTATKRARGASAVRR